MERAMLLACLLVVTVRGEWLAEIKGLPANILQQGYPDKLKLLLQWTDDGHKPCNTTLHLQQNNAVSSVVHIHGVNQLTGQAAVLSSDIIEDAAFYQDKLQQAAVSVYNEGDSVHVRGGFISNFGYLRIEPYNIRIHKRHADLKSDSNGLHIVKRETQRPVTRELGVDERLDSLIQQIEALEKKRMLSDDEDRADQPELIDMADKRNVLAYVIEIHVAVDYAMYQEFVLLQQMIGWKSSLHHLIAFSMTHMVNEIDARYMAISTLPYTIRAQLTDIYIASVPELSPWTSSHALPSGVVDADRAILEFQNWVKQQYPIDQSADHFMLVTGHNLCVVKDNTCSMNIGGIAYRGGACTDKRVSVTEYPMYSTAPAHELGHNLGAGHDSLTLGCDPYDRYVMSPLTGGSKEEQLGNQWKFSSCSIDFFESYIERLDGLNQNCLKVSYKNIAQSQYLVERFGQLIGPDEQCAIRHGPDFVFRGGYDYSVSVCGKLMCYNKVRSSITGSYGAITHTSCGANMWCVNERCVYDPSAPSVNAKCPLGDERGKLSASYETTCDTVPATRCSEAAIARRCCARCEREQIATVRAQLDAQCQTKLGDTSYSFLGTMSAASEVCQTLWCHKEGVFGSSVSSTADEYTPCGNTKWCVQRQCTFSDSAPATSETCPLGEVAGPIPTKPDLTCSTIVAADCYNTALSDACCLTCEKLQKPWLPANCKYGNRAPWCQTYYDMYKEDVSQFCKSYSFTCCESCIWDD